MSAPKGRFYTQEEVAWLAGLFEAEGSFMKAAPSRPAAPIAKIEMCDLDVIEHVCELLRVKPFFLRKRKANHQDAWRATLVGQDAVRFMNTLYPWMGVRRRRQIEEASATFSPYQTQVTYQQAVEMRTANAEEGVNSMELARRYGIDDGYVRCILRGEVMKGDKHSVEPFVSVPAFLNQNARMKMFWFAGYLEGEGCFMDSGGTPVVQVTSCDFDIAERTAWMFGGKDLTEIPPRNDNWNISYRCQTSSFAALALMQALRPLMGARRGARIDEIYESLAANEDANMVESDEIRPVLQAAS